MIVATNFLPDFGIYTISFEHIDRLKNINPDIISPNITTTYCGPLFKVSTQSGVYDFFAPVDVWEYKMQPCFTMAFHNNTYSDVVDFKGMIPCSSADYSKDNQNPKLEQFCKNVQDDMKKYAKYVYLTSLKGYY